MVDVAGIAWQAQQVAQALMVDSCTVRRPTGETTTDPDTGEVAEAYTQVYSGQCRLRDGTSVSGSMIGEAEVFMARATLDMPASADALAPNDLATVDASLSPGLVGRVCRVMGPWTQTASSSCRYIVDVSTLPPVDPS